MEPNVDLQRIFPSPSLAQVRAAVRARRIAAWEATKAAMIEAEAQARARRWIPIDEAASDAVDALGRRIEQQHLVAEPWGRW